MDTAPTDRTSEDDDDVVEASAHVVSIALVPMEAGLSTRADMEPMEPEERSLRAKVAALRFLKEFPQIPERDIGTLIDTFDIDRDYYEDEDARGVAETDTENAPSTRLLMHVQRIAERDYGRKHQSDNWPEWPEVAERKQRERERVAAVDAENRRKQDERATMPHRDAEKAAETPDAETRPDTPEPDADAVKVDTGYSIRYRALVESVMRRVEAHPDIRRDPLAVLVVRVMLDRADARTRETWQGIATIARRAGMNEMTVTRKLAALKGAGIITLVKQGGTGPGKASRYKF